MLKGRRSVLLIVWTLSFLWFSTPSWGQACLGLPPARTHVSITLGVEGQGDGQRFGGWVHGTVAGKLGVLFGAGVGTLDDFAEGVSEMRGMVSWSLGADPAFSCLFLEYEQARESFRNALRVDSGYYTEHWTRFGWAVGKTFAQLGTVELSAHAAPEVIWRLSQVNGRTLFLEPPPGHTVSSKRREEAFHLGGRVIISAGHPRFSVNLSLKSRPRISSDLLWGVHLGFPL